MFQIIYLFILPFCHYCLRGTLVKRFLLNTVERTSFSYTFFIKDFKTKKYGFSTL